jgi:formylmethanofuran dehydrogenase subunit D
MLRENIGKRTFQPFMPTEFILIPGRTSRHGTSLNEGKYSDTYQSEINTLLMNPRDMARLELVEGDRVRMWNRVGEVVVSVKSGKDELPPGLLFITYGDISSRLMGAETHGSGMPDSKGLDVLVEKLVEKVS